MSRNQAFDYLLKLIIIGDAGVGKTCILLKYVGEDFQAPHISTIGKYHPPNKIVGIDFKINVIKLNGKSVKVQIWDTAGQERFRTITQTYYRGAQGVILAYDCTSEESFANVNTWVQQVNMHAQKGVQKILLANKADMSEKKVISEE